MNDQPAGSMSDQEAETLLSAPTEATPGPPTVAETPKVVLRYIKQRLLPRQGTPEAKAKLRADMRMGRRAAEIAGAIKAKWTEDQKRHMMDDSQLTTESVIKGEIMRCYQEMNHLEDTLARLRKLMMGIEARSDGTEVACGEKLKIEAIRFYPATLREHETLSARVISLTERLKEKKGGNKPQFQNKPPPPPPQNIIINTGTPQMPNGVDTSRAPRMIGPSIPMEEK